MAFASGPFYFLEIPQICPECCLNYFTPQVSSQSFAISQACSLFSVPIVDHGTEAKQIVSVVTSFPLRLTMRLPARSGCICRRPYMSPGWRRRLERVVARYITIGQLGARRGTTDAARPKRRDRRHYHRPPAARSTRWTRSRGFVERSPDHSQRAARVGTEHSILEARRKAELRRKTHRVDWYE